VERTAEAAQYRLVQSSASRTTEKNIDLAATIPAVRSTDYDPSAPHPSSELLGYYHSSATRTYSSQIVATRK
jgi:hypothetical protein